MQFKDYYQVMGIDRNATPDEIKRAYRKLARKYHPDVSKEANAEDKFKELQEAYEVLKDPEKRKKYDHLGANWQAGDNFTPPPEWEHPQGEGDGGFNFNSDFFESLFGGGFGGQRSRRRQYSHAGEDYHGKIQISLEEAHSGTVKQVQLPISQLDANGQPTVTMKTLKVKIPAGVKAGQQIRLPGQGAEGIGGGPKGNLYLEIDFHKHPKFDVIKNDVYYTLPITPWEAALGTTIPVPTLAGKVDMKIPAGSQAGQKLRLKGRGLPNHPAGDQYVLLKIVIPQPKTENAKALYAKMAEEMPFNPREDIGA